MGQGLLLVGSGIPGSGGNRDSVGRYGVLSGRLQSSHWHFADRCQPVQYEENGITDHVRTCDCC